MLFIILELIYYKFAMNLSHSNKVSENKLPENIHSHLGSDAKASLSFEIMSRTLWSGLMVGDALGAPAESKYYGDVMKLFPNGLDRMVAGYGIRSIRKAGEVTDDTQMAWFLHQALQAAGGWSLNKAWVYYLEWMNTCPLDAGEVTKQALMLGKRRPEAQDNASLARVMPLALWAAQHPGFDWETAAREDAALTHPHPVNGDCNVVYVYALCLAIKGSMSAQEIYTFTLCWAEAHGIVPEVIDTLRRAATERPDYAGKDASRVRTALQSAFYQLLHARDFRSALVDIVSSGGDTDTNAAIAGPLLAAVHGPQSIPSKWMACVRMANEPRYVELVLRRKDTATTHNRVKSETFPEQ